jgi:hypothetical protein
MVKVVETLTSKCKTLSSSGNSFVDPSELRKREKL